MKRLTPLLVLAAGSFVHAADPFDVHCADIRVMQDRAVQTDMKITAAQREKMNRYATEFATKANAILKGYKKPPTGPDPKITALGNKMKMQVISVLSPTQLRRLREISLQVVNALAVADPVVAKRVGVTAAQLATFQTTIKDGQQRALVIQRNALNPIVAKYRAKGKPKNEAEAKKLQAAFTGEMKAASRGIKPRIDALSKETSNKLRKVLTPKQIATFDALKGKPFRS